ncbi:hypothetical protein [Paraburkholderia tropica]|uniref:hypothetical protein n=1 Tax=Paraburkholderia tropica TaxID=92647 RepID=UPI0015923654|nr:hypothetical protein [Paraburkholderia tropica]
MATQPRAVTSFYHGKQYRKGDIVEESDAVIADLEKDGLVTTKDAPAPSNKKAPEPENKKAK